MSSFKRRSIIVLLWLVLVPAAIAAATLVRLILIIGNRWTMSEVADPDSFLASTVITIISTVAYAATLIYVSAYIAPAGKKAVSIVVATLVTTGAIGLFVTALMEMVFEPILFSMCVMVGACATSYLIVNEDLKMPDELAWTSSDYEGEDVSLSATDDLRRQAKHP